MRKYLLVAILSFACLLQAKDIVDYVNPFIGTTNFGTCNPGAVCPNGMMSVSPFNVMGSDMNAYDKDARWWSTPYDFTNKYFTGYSHVNLSGVGCPDLGSLLLMPTSGVLNVDYKQYGSTYSNERAVPGLYSNVLDRYNIKTEVSATLRTGISRFTFPAGESHILLNLGEGLTNESGAMLRKVNDQEIEGMKLVGTFCYTPQAVFPIYFVMRINKKPSQMGYWKKQRPMDAEAAWDVHSGSYKLYTQYTKELAGDDIGTWFTFQTEADEAIEVRLGVSFVSIENARLNLEAESNLPFDEICNNSRKLWKDALSKIELKGGTESQKTVFYTALYHTLIHPSIFQDVNGDYPMMEGDQVMNTKQNHYTVFSLWDTYRNVHQLFTLLYPDKQLDMIRSMLDMYREHGWLPKWELFGRETLTMEGDPSIPVIVDTWFKGLRDFDISLAYEAMCKGAFTTGSDNLLRPDIDDYLKYGVVPLREKYDNSVSHALEYYIADHALAKLAKELGHQADSKKLQERSLQYKKYYSKEFGTLRPILPDGSFLTPFNPEQGKDFEPCPGFHEGTAWNYTFYVPHDVYGLAQLMGGKKQFVKKLQSVFDANLYDPANEPDIAYPYLFSYFKGEEGRTQKIVKELLNKYYTNKPDGLPGNDDTGTMSAWAVFSMMGFYPDCPGESSYTLTTPTFDEIILHLDPRYYKEKQIVIRKINPKDASNDLIQRINVNSKEYDSYRITHDKLVNGKLLEFFIQN